MRRLWVIGVVVLTPLVLSVLLAKDKSAENPRADELATATRQAKSERVEALYDRWVASHESRGGDRSVRLALGYFKGLSVEHTRARGLATLDLIEGAVEVEVAGLPAGVSEVWLVDNVPGPGRSTRPEPGDHMIHLGDLSTDGESAATLTARVAEGTFESFQLDAVVVSRSGEGPVAGPVLFGSPALFQRLYTKTRLAETGARGSETASRAPTATESLLGVSTAHAAPTAITPATVFDGLVAQGADLFVNETFAGNGRTCATCHPAVNNFTIDPKFIAGLPANDPLFVAEFNPDLATLERPKLMRSRGLILENLDGFDDLENRFTMRGVPHILGMGTTLEGPNIPFDNTFNPEFGIFPPGQRTGWSGDGAPGSGTLRDFATGAVTQHFPRTLAREPGVDFRLPTDDELDALEAFQLSAGRAGEIDISSGTGTELVFSDPVVERGKAIFNATDTQEGTVAAGKCTLCHLNAGANIDGDFFGAVIPGLMGGNANFGTGINDLPDLAADIIDKPNNPRDGGFARVAHDGENCVPFRGGFGTVTPPGGVLPAGLCEEDFNTPSLVEAADTPPFFHNNSADTLEAAVAFYNDEEFNGSPGGLILAALDSGGVAIELTSTQVTAVANMLRTVNSLENIRSAIDLAEASLFSGGGDARELLEVATAELVDGVEVLEGAGLSADAVARLRAAESLTISARNSFIGFFRVIFTFAAIDEANAARDLMLE